MNVHEHADNGTKSDNNSYRSQMLKVELNFVA